MVKVECSVCGEVYNAKKGSSSKCPNCSTKNNISSDLEIPVNIVKDYVDSIGLGSMGDFDKEEIKDNLNSYMNYKTLTKAKKAELELMEIEERLKEIKNNGRWKNNGNGRDLKDINNSTFEGTSPLIVNSLLRMDNEERDKLLTDLSENPEKAYVLSMLLNPSTNYGTYSNPIGMGLLPLLLNRSSGSLESEKGGVGAMGEVMASFANSMNSVFSSILEVLTKREENAIKPTEYITSMAEMINVFKESQSSQETYMNNMLEMFKLLVQNNQPQYVSEGTSEQVLPVVIELFKMFLNSKTEGKDELKEKLNQIEEKVIKQSEETKERQLKQEINELKSEIARLKNQDNAKQKSSDNIEKLKELKDQVDLLVDLGIVRKNNDPLLIKENEKGEKVVVQSSQNKELGVDDKIKLEEWDLKKKKQLLELDLMKLREENKIKKEMEQTEKEEEIEKERYKTLNSLIEGGSALFSSLLNANSSKENSKKEEKNELIDIPITFENTEKKKRTKDAEEEIVKTQKLKQKFNGKGFKSSINKPTPVFL